MCVCIPWRREWQPTPLFLHGKFHGQRSLVGHSPWGHKESDMTERLSAHRHTHTHTHTHTHLHIYLLALPHGTSRESNGTPLQYSCLENPMDRGAWWAAVHGVTKSQTRLNDFTFTFHFHAFEKEMATHYSVLAWRIPGTAELGGLPSMGLHRVGHNRIDLAAAAARY